MTKFLVIAGVVGLLGAGTGWMAMAVTNTTRPDCPDQIECPLTDKQGCKDRCPVAVAPIPVAVSGTTEKLCGGACPAPTPAPKPDKP